MDTAPEKEESEKPEKKDAKPAPKKKSRLKRWQKWVVGLVVAVLVYTIGGFLIAPIIAKSVARNMIADQTGLEAHIGKIKINPYALTLTVEEFTAAPPGETNWVTLGRMFANAQIESLFGPDIVVKEVRLEQPELLVRWNDDGRFNLLTILDNLPKTTNTEPFEMPGLRVDQLSISNAVVRWLDEYLVADFRAEVAKVDLTLTNFHTLRTNQFTFRATADGDTGISVDGRFSIEPISAEVHAEVDGLFLERYADYIPAWTPLRLNGGRVNTSVDAAVALLDDKLSAAASNANVRVENLALTAVEDGESVLELDGVNVVGAAANLQALSASIEEVSVKGVRLKANRFEDGSIDWLTRVDTVISNLPVAEAKSDPAAPTSPWKWSVKRLAVEKADVTVNDNAVMEPVTLGVRNASVNVTDLNPDFSKPIPLELGFELETGGSGTIAGNVTPMPLSAELKVDVNDFYFPIGQPYVHDILKLQLKDGTVSVSGDVKAALNQITNMYAFFLGDIHVKNVEVDEEMGDPLASVKEVQVDHLEVDWPIDDFQVQRVFVDSPRAALYLREDGTANVEEIVPESVTEKLAAQIQQAWQLLQFEVGELAVTNAYVHFEDRSLDPTTVAAVTNAFVSLVGLSPTATEPAQVEVGGLILPRAPLSVVATIDASTTNVAATAAVNVQMVQLPPGSAYSGKFAGYLIDSGHVSADLRYTLKGEQIEGENRIIVREFEFGEKRESEEALKLPVKLGVSLLKDSEGTIDLDVPVEGDLRDPEFRLGKVIWATIGNIMKKAVTAPFKFLGGLVGAGDDEDLSYAEFAPGDAVLTDAEKKKVGKLAQALQARPALRLEIVGRFDPAQDAAHLRDEQFEQWLNELKAEIADDPELAKLARTFRDPSEPSRDELVTVLFIREFGVSYETPEKPPADLIARNALEQRTQQYIAAAEAQPAELGERDESFWNRVWASMNESDEDGAFISESTATTSLTARVVTIEEPLPVLPEMPSVNEMESRLLENVKLDESILVELARQRSLAVMAFLEGESGISADRLKLVDELSGEEPARPEPRVFLGIF